MSDTSNYRIIQDEAVLKDFIRWLPELRPGEVYYGCLFARKKYDPTGVVKNDKNQLKRFTATSKEYLVQKFKQMECEYGTYRTKGMPIPQNALALYMMPNPRSLKRATQKTLVELARLLASDQPITKNPSKVALSELQKNASRKVYLGFDYDGIKLSREDFVPVINPECVTILNTRGGCHALVEVAKIGPRYTKTWHKGMSSIPGCDVRGDVLMPVPGCTQGGYVPFLEEVGENEI